MLPWRPPMAVPDLFKDCVLPEVVNVPVGAAGRLHVMREPGTDASGAERTADIDVEPGLEPQFAEPPDPDGPTRCRRKHQDVCSRLGFYRRHVETRPATVFDQHQALPTFLMSNLRHLLTMLHQMEVCHGHLCDPQPHLARCVP